MNTNSFFCLGVVVSLAAGSACAQPPSPSQPAPSAHDLYIQANAADYDWFANASDSYAGVPHVLLKSLPDLAPEIWGSSEELFSGFGLFTSPEEPDRPLPLGLSWDSMDPEAPTQPFRMVALTCGACHIGQVRGADGRYQTLIGAPNTAFDVRRWRKAFESTVHEYMGSEMDVAATATRLREIVSGKPANYYFAGYRGFSDQDEAGERAKFTAPGVTEATLQAFVTQILLGEAAVNKQKATSYSAVNAPPLDGGSPGQSDGSGDLIPRLLMLRTVGQRGPEATITDMAGIHYPELPIELATVTDILSTWEQGRRNIAQVDGSVKSPLFRNVAASLAVAGSPTNVNVKNAEVTARFMRDLPPPPYPFDIDQAQAERGKAVFDANCAQCHRDFNDNVYSVDDLGVDPNRARVLNEEALNLFLTYFTASVPQDFETTDADGNVSRPRELASSDVVVDRTQPENQGYVTNHLEGLWARAPYLHNGAVPTVYHLLVPGERPDTFVRGALGYNVERVGYEWEAAQLDQYRRSDPTASLYDTSWDSASNTGHDTNLIVSADGEVLRVGWDGGEGVNGIRVRLDWTDDELAADLADLIEYLKTL